MLPTIIFFLAGASVAPRFGPPVGSPARIALDGEPWTASVYPDASCTVSDPAFGTFVELEVWRQGDFICEVESYPGSPETPPNWFRAQVLCRDDGEVAIEYYLCNANCGRCDEYWGTVSHTEEEWAKINRGECAEVTCEGCFGGITITLWSLEEAGKHIFGADICSTSNSVDVGPPFGPAIGPRIALDNEPWSASSYQDAGCTISVDPVFGTFTELEVWKQGDFVCAKSFYPGAPDVPPNWSRGQVLCRDDGEVAIEYYICDKENCAGSCDEYFGIVSSTEEEWAKLTRGECSQYTCEGCLGGPDFSGWSIEEPGAVFDADICSGRTTHHQSRVRVGQVAVVGAAAFFLLGVGIMARRSRSITDGDGDGDDEAPNNILASDFSTVPELESDFSTELATPAHAEQL